VKRPPVYVGLTQRVVINDLLTQITAVFVTIGGEGQAMEAAVKQQEIVGFWPIPDMAQEMRVEHDRLAQLGWVYDGFGGYRKKAASSHPVQNFAVLTCKAKRRTQTAITKIR
jgi:hypothetical protein